MPMSTMASAGFFFSSSSRHTTCLSDWSSDVCSSDLRLTSSCDTEEEVIRRANATKFGLAAYFYTRDMTRLVRVAEQLEYGLVGANDAAGYTHEIPFGGFKESGLGREGGHEGIEEYTEVKSVVVNLG